MTPTNHHHSVQTTTVISGDSRDPGTDSVGVTDKVTIIILDSDGGIAHQTHGFASFADPGVATQSVHPMSRFVASASIA